MLKEDFFKRKVYLTKEPNVLIMMCGNKEPVNLLMQESEVFSNKADSVP